MEVREHEAVIPPAQQAAGVVTSLEELLGHLLDTIILATGAQEGSLMLLHEGRELLTVNSARGPREQLVRSTLRRLGEGISGWVAQNREPLLLIGPVDDARFPGTARDLKDAMCVPLIVEDRVIGVLSVSNKKGEATFNQADLDHLLAITQPVAKTIALTLTQREADAESSAWARRQLAQEIHDGLLQDLNSLLLHLRLFEEYRERDAGEAAEQLEKSRHQAEESLVELRHLVFDLRLPEAGRLSLVHELRGYVADFGKRSRIQAVFNVVGSERELPLSVKKNLYRIAQEALTNVRRHAAARRVEVRLEFRSDEVELSIRDDGHGFRPEVALAQAETSKRFGLIGMKERTYLLGGQFYLQTAPGQGTVIRVVVPL